VRDVELLLDHFLELGYRFVTADQVASGLDPESHCAMVTFDDGYHSALRVLPVLRQFRVPATFFVSSSHVAEGKGFWWDVLYRERSRRGTPVAAIRREKEYWLRRPPIEAEAHVTAAFGVDALSTSPGDSWRAMTPRELRELAQDPLATLGNHTADHANLTLLDEGEVRAQIRRCQSYLSGVTGAPPLAIAYPGGRRSRRIDVVARSEGLRLGMTIEPHKNRLPLRDGEEMALGRYCFGNDAPIVEQCRTCRSGIQLLNTARRLQHRLQRD
jgi:peptidoglycan/xylan/chitin deacetylase (PgdA/CDA1 family)